ncbi:hypothetical protein B296_00040912 [Ensete ventricosum]|uniref:Uncharacterized protein n=1 Tax=Ensete ventricosum TaxID=4639 RepID=A0A426Z3L0_ENSVE|nr:hypothetical protein B296_00040912 [Ensete ventricosum]
MVAIRHGRPAHLGRTNHPLRLGNLNRRFTSNGQETLATRVAHAAKTLGYMGGPFHGQELVALGLTVFGQAKSNILTLNQGCKQPLAIL